MRTCYYVLLDVEKTATDDELKKAYRRQALLHHPDKNPDRVDEATKYFAEIQNAYEVLSDPQERAWYDSHRESILRGDEENDFFEDQSNARTKGGDRGWRFWSGGYAIGEEQLMRFFSPSCYSGFGLDENGFFNVFAKLFQTVEADEEKALMDDSENLCSQGVVEYDSTSAPFGGPQDRFDGVPKDFYNKFLGFSTIKSFRWADKYDPAQGKGDRFVRRAIERENLKIRDAARRSFNETVRRLAQFVQKRDPRYRQAQEEIRVERERKAAEAKERMKAERAERLRQAEKFSAPAWATAGEEQLVEDLEELTFEDATEDPDDELVCVACDKVFKSEKQWKNHEKSKKHLRNVELLRMQMLEEDEEYQGLPTEEGAGEEGNDGDSDDFHDSSADIIDGVTDAVGSTTRDFDDISDQSDIYNDDCDDGAAGQINDAGSAVCEDQAEDDEGDVPDLIDRARRKRQKRLRKKGATTFGGEKDDDDYAARDDNDDDDVGGGENFGADLVGKKDTVTEKTGGTGAYADTPSDDEADVGGRSGASGKVSAKDKRRAREALRQKKISEDQLSCNFCKECFPSRNKLFEHVSLTGHAIATSSSVSNSKKNGNNKGSSKSKRK